MCLTMLLISQTIVLGQTHRTKKRVVKKTTTTFSQLNKGKKRPTSMDTLFERFAQTGQNPFGALPSLIADYQMPIWNAYEGSTGQNKLYAGRPYGELCAEYISKSKELQNHFPGAVISTTTDADLGLKLAEEFHVVGFTASGTAGAYAGIYEKVSIRAKVAYDNLPHRSNLALVVYSGDEREYWGLENLDAYYYNHSEGYLTFFVKISACNSYIMSHIHHILLTSTQSEAYKKANSKRISMEADFSTKYMPRMF